MLKNKKGIVPVVLAFWIAFGLVGAVCIANIPAWTKAKAAHCESAFQAGDTNCGNKH